MNEKGTLLLVDLSAVFWWKWHGAAGQDVDAAYRYSVEKVRSLASSADHVAVCCDSPTSWRKERYPAYKANRPPKDQAAMEQLRRVEETLIADGFPLLRADGYEGDDVIAKATAWGLGNSFEVVIAGTDKDLLSLLLPGVTLRHLLKDETWDADRVKTNIGVTPAQMRDFLALVGDQADNVKGAPGIGPQKAIKLLADYGSIGEMYDKIDSIQPESVRKSLAENKEAVELAAELVTLRADAPVDCSVILRKREPKEIVKAQMSESDFEPSGEKMPTQTVSAVQEEPKQAAPLVHVDPDTNDPRWQLAMEPKTAGQAYSLAKAIFSSRLYQKFPNPEAIFAVILRGRSMGIDMMTALDGFHVIEGKPTMSAALIIGVVQRSGKAEFFDLIETSSEKATWETKRAGARKPISLSWTIKDAQAAGLIKPRSAWEKFPRAMLQWRAGVELARAIYPDVVANVYSPDEIGDESHVDTTVVDVRRTA